MAITISGANNVDKILATDGVLDSISGFNVVGVMTAGTFDVTGKTTTGHLNIGSNIQIGNAGIITATTLVGNVTGNINATSNLLLQIGGSEKFRVASSGQLGIGGANYGSAGQVLTSGGSGSAATWSTITQGVTSDGSQNTVGGTNAGDSIVSGGTENTVFGYNAGTAISTGDNNTFFGSRAGRSISTGLQNTGVGYNVMGNTSGTGNAALGQNAGNGIGAGSYNVALGWSALSDVSTNGANNIVIGKQANVSAANMSNEVTIGNSDINHFRIPGIGVSFSEGGAVFSGIVTASSYRGDGSQLTGITGTTINNNADNRIITGSGTANNAVSFSRAFQVTTTKTFHFGSQTSLGKYNDGVEGCSWYDEKKSWQQGQDGGIGWSMMYMNKIGSGDNRLIQFNSSGSNIGYINRSGSNVAYLTSSDYRLKKDVVVLPNGIERVKQLRPVAFKWIQDDSDMEGFLAHEAQEVCPYAVSGTKDEVALEDHGDRKKGDMIVQAVDYGEFTPLLTAAMKELITKVETLEQDNIALRARVTNLEGN